MVRILKVFYFPLITCSAAWPLGSFFASPCCLYLAIEITIMAEKTDIGITALLNKIYDDSLPLLAKIAPERWAKIEYLRFLHPTGNNNMMSKKTLPRI